MDAFVVEAWKDGAWAQIASGTSIGSCRIIRLDQPVKANRVRYRIVASRGEPDISEFGAYADL